MASGINSGTFFQRQYRSDGSYQLNSRPTNVVASSYHQGSSHSPLAGSSVLSGDQYPEMIDDTSAHGAKFTHTRSTNTRLNANIKTHGPSLHHPHNGIGSYQNYQGYQPPPQTPFDLSYGVSLLPSHLLVSSPYLASPQHTPRRHNPIPLSSYRSFPLRMPPGNDRRKLRNSESYCREDGVRQIPFQIMFEVLPPTVIDDESRTPSLLFSNVSPELSLHDFLTKFDDSERVESLFRVDAEQQSIIVSFLTQETCLDFYNGVLQKLFDFKKELQSPRLSLSFVRLEDPMSGPTMHDVKFEVLRVGATRSLALEFSSEITSKSLFENLAFLNNRGPRYVVECIEIVNTEKVSKNFGSHYAIIHFISIAMAIETLEYLKVHQRSVPDLQKFFYISRALNSMTSELHTLSSSQLREPKSPSTSISTLSLGRDSTPLASKKIRETITIHPTSYDPPYVQLHTQHLPHYTASKPLSMESVNGSSTTIASPAPQEVLINDIDDISSCGSMVSIVPNQTGSHAYPMGGYPYYMDMTKPLGQTLQQQYCTAAQFATTMGGGLGNRTVYIGNINQRSKVEDVCNVVRGGLLQKVKFIASKQICFFTFIEAAAAVQFFANASIEPIVLHGNVLRVGWGHHSGDLPKFISLAVTAGASRNVYVSLPEHAFKDKFIKDPEYQTHKEKFKLPSKEVLLQDFRKYGEIEQINFLPDGHCCWINFMNILHAIKLVEDANNMNNEKSFHGRYGERYRGLIVGYGKDRCGNVNKNLVANKNSKHYKKVKKTSYKIRMHKQQSKKPSDLRENEDSGIGNRALPTDAFGIIVPKPKTSVGDSDVEEGENLRMSNSHIETEDGGLGISVRQSSPELDSNADSPLREPAEGDYGSSDSSDVDIIVSAPNSAGHSQLRDNNKSFKKQPHYFPDTQQDYGSRAFTGLSPMDSSTSLDAVPPLAPSTVGRLYHAATRKSSNKTVRDGNSSVVVDPLPEVCPSRSSIPPGSRRRKSKAIPGSNVMAQYLAQLQHSTFMYAANILGVEDGDPQVYYDENGVADPLI
ncbi:LADA_0H05182g1_1 [Lachancea dasiensis]|uniref:LADA_0H05182g1_1 n=1 Tax=Lachancea dasiensis TaxID=1072105 RepID=A0A1G4K115_9SACH|nr:LADA_0H05182g1_1 [Lachancea dasiensis]